MTDLVVARNSAAESERRFRLLAENASDIVLEAGTDGTISWVSPSVSRVIGWQPDQLVGHGALELIHPDDLLAIAKGQERIRQGEVVEFEARVRTPTGAYRWISSRVSPLLDDSGILTGRVAAWRDIESAHAAREALRESEERYRLLAENASDIVYRSGPDRLIQWIAPTVERSLGWTPEELVGTTFNDLIHPDDQPGTGPERERVYHGESPDVPVGGLPMRLRTKDGRYLWFSGTASPVLGADNRPAGVVAGLTLVDDLVRERQRVAASEERFRLLAENSTDVVLLAQDGIMRWLSPSLTTALGWQPEQWEQHRFEEFTHPDDIELAQQRRAEISEGGRRVTTLRMRDAEGDYHWVEIHAGPFINAQGESDGIVASFRVVDAEVADRNELEHLARFDVLTGVLNRTEILHKLSGMSTGARRPGERTAVLFCDIDRFKEINDTYGHAAGDEVLRTLAERLGAAVRDEDYVARIGGDELLVILTAVHGLEDATTVAEKIREAASVSIGLEGARVSTTLSIGVTLMQIGESVDSLVARADAAMYEAKSAGRNQVIAIG